MLFILIGTAGPSFNTSLPNADASPSVVAAHRLTFLSLCLYVPNSWGAAASDFYVYYPERSSKVKVFFLTLSGLWLSFSFVYLLGIGFGSGIATSEAWTSAYSTSVGALIVAGYDPLAGFGRFCAVVVALGVIANSIPGTYSAALGCQVLGRYGFAVPRWIWSCVLIVIQLVLALAGREHLMAVMQNFLALMGYWIEFMVIIVLVEHLWFRRRRGATFDWSRWADKEYLPVGLAALAAFLMGWVGAVLGMFQNWYTGPLAQLSGPADVGLWVGSGFTILTYFPLRWAELKYFKR